MSRPPDITFQVGEGPVQVDYVTYLSVAFKHRSSSASLMCFFHVSVKLVGLSLFSF
uniref:Uncharacterized protein n=1 Tax=Setaria italica TaxID=4555 RepID=K3Y0T5_SETIT